MLENGAFARALFEFELEEHIEGYTQSRHNDHDDYFFAVTEHTNDVAMLLIDDKDHLYINEDARAMLQKLWGKAYAGNIRKMIPGMASELDRGYLFIAGVKVGDPKQFKKVK
ncbi:MAG: hypothetical protein HZC40_17320 [Chloroflexi bacterium]|nr:hypothetical protein [Chloroflexota bacterium]